jgi:hypothetical protein
MRNTVPNPCKPLEACSVRFNNQLVKSIIYEATA